MKIKDRIRQKTPPFWRKVGNYSLIGGAIISGLAIGLKQGGIEISLFGTELNTILATIGGTLAAVGKGLASLVIND